MFAICKQTLNNDSFAKFRWDEIKWKSWRALAFKPIRIHVDKGESGRKEKVREWSTAGNKASHHVRLVPVVQSPRSVSTEVRYEIVRHRSSCRTIFIRSYRRADRHSEYSTSNELLKGREALIPSPTCNFSPGMNSFPRIVKRSFAPAWTPQTRNKTNMRFVKNSRIARQSSEGRTRESSAWGIM